MAMSATGLNSCVGEVGKDEICERVHYLGSVVGRIVILFAAVREALSKVEGCKQTSSHQLMVDVTGLQ